MTRDEAIKVINERVWGSNETSMSGRWADVFAALGGLKLDEPKSAWERFRDTFVELEDYDPDDSDPTTIVADIKKALEKANLKIVEK